MDVVEYIKNNIIKTKRENREDSGNLIGLPYSYTVPCIDSIFNELYYWDSYFTNKGLIQCGYIELAKNNVLDILFLVEKYGYMPNGNRLHFLKGSQPPFLAMMVDDIFNKINDIEFLETSYNTLKKEYSFWMTKRVSENGLNHYDTDREESTFKDFFLNYVSSRIKIDTSREPTLAGRNYFAECESGWDFNPRFYGRCCEFNSVDLNCNLYLYEVLLEKFSKILGKNEEDFWKQKSIERKDKINKYLLDKTTNTYRDYDYINKRLSNVYSVASFWPYYVKLSNDIKGANFVYEKLKSSFGVFATEKVDNAFQWAYPNIWAPLQYISYIAMKNCGNEDIAKEIAKKYTLLIENNFKKYNKLFEKYNGISGDIDAVSEYGTPEMMGWTAGVYMAIHN